MKLKGSRHERQHGDKSARFCHLADLGDRRRVDPMLKKSIGDWVLFIVKESGERTGLETVRTKER